MDKKPTAPALPPADPPHGGSWLRKADGSLELLQTTQPATGRRGAPPPATSVNETPEE
ncbi:MAG TPA: hypothetical protein VHL79_12305 [Ramlibacter sp.]|jgi:hypothetical protein|nr:hypothetical protein [Ramlibacter sp.]